MVFYIRDIIQGLTLIGVVVILYGLYFYQQRVYKGRDRIWIQLEGGMITGVLALITFWFNYVHDANVLLLMELLTLSLTVYLFRRALPVIVVYTVFIVGHAITLHHLYILIIHAMMILVLFLNGRRLKGINSFAVFTLVVTLFFYLIGALFLNFDFLTTVLNVIALISIELFSHLILQHIEVTYERYYTYYKYSGKDYLTKLYNRRKLDLDRTLFEKNGYKTIAIAFLDVDDFKSINDTHGHRFGDEVLRSIAKVILEEKKANYYAYRLSGEEFCLIMRNWSIQQSRDWVRRIQKRISNLSFDEIESDKFSVTLSCGIIHAKGNENPIKALIEEADHLMYEAKRRGKNGLVEKRV